MPIKRPYSTQHDKQQKIFKRRRKELDLSKPMPFSTDNQLDSIGNLNNEFEDLQEFQLSEVPSNGLPLSTDFLNLNQNDCNQTPCEIVLSKLLHLHKDKKVSNIVLDEVLKIIDIVVKHKSHNFEEIPSSFYHFNKKYSIPIGRYYGFITQCCNNQILQQKSTNNKFYCSNCDLFINCKEIFLEREYFFHFNLREIIIHLLNSYKFIEPEFSKDSKINSVYDSEVFKSLYNLDKGKLLIISTNIDGAVVDNSHLKNEIWPILIKIINLDCDEEHKTFLASCAITQEPKPDPNFYLKYLVDQLNDLFVNGIEHDGEIIYVALFNQIYDTPARNSFLCNVAFNTSFGCVLCLNEGVRFGYVHLYLPEPVVIRKSKEIYKEAFKKVEDGYSSYLGITAKSVLFDLPYYDPSKSTTIDLMHALGLGTVKRLMAFQSTYQNRFSHSYIFDIKVFDSRLIKFKINNDFKRIILPSSKLNKWKANQSMSYFFYVAPLCLRSLLSNASYYHYFQLVFCISKLWNSGLNETDLEFIKEQIVDFLKDISKLYSQ